MKPIVRYLIWAAVIGAVSYAAYQGYKIYKAKQAAAGK